MKSVTHQPVFKPNATPNASSSGRHRLITNVSRWQLSTGPDCPPFPAQSGSQRCPVTPQSRPGPSEDAAVWTSPPIVPALAPLHPKKHCMSPSAFWLNVLYIATWNLYWGGWDVVHKTLLRMLWKCNSLSSIYLNLICFVPCHTY